MPFPKISARFKKPADAPAPSAAVPAAEAATPAAEPVGPVAVATEAAATVIPHAAEAVVKASRLVEGERRPFLRRIPIAAIRQAATKAATAGKPAAKPIAAAVALAAVLGVGYGVGASGRSGATVTALSEAASSLRESHGELARLSAELRTVKAGVEGLKGDRERSRNDGSARQAQLLDKLERAGQENAARVARLGEQLDRVEKTQRDPARLQAFVDRLDRIEKGMQIASSPQAPAATPTLSAAPTPPPKPVIAAKETVGDVQQTGSLGEAKPGKPDAAKEAARLETDPRRTQLEGYAVRDIDDGYALIEMKSGRFLEVTVGQIIPGIGKIEAIERRGRQWVVVTAKGYVGERWN